MRMALSYPHRITLDFNDKITADCPSHEGRENPLLVRKGRDDVELECLAGCRRDDILSALHLQDGTPSSKAHPDRNGSRAQNPRAKSKNQRTRTAPPRKQFGDAVPVSATGSLTTYRADDLLEYARQPVKWRVRGLLVEGTYTIVGGAKKTFKTSLVSAELAYSIANGVEWLGDPRFVVESPSPVLVLINEGLRPYLRTLDRIRQRTKAETIGQIGVVEAQGIRWSEPDFESGLRDAVKAIDAGVVVFDAAYGFIGGEVEAANVFSMSDELACVQKLCSELEIDLIVVHHLKKNQRRGRPDLDDLAWAGFAEWADSWILLKHTRTPNIATGQYAIGVIAGSRQGFEFAYEIEGDSGPYDLEENSPSHPTLWNVLPVSIEEADKWGKNLRRHSGGDEGIRTLVEHRPFELTVSQLANEAPGGDQQNRKRIDQMLTSGELVARNMKRREGRRSVPRSLVGLPDAEPPEDVINVVLPKE